MGLLEDAIASGNTELMRNASPLFQPSPMMGVYNMAENVADTQPNRLNPINPLTGRQWGEYDAIYQNNDTKALMERDQARTKILAAVGQLDPDLQPLIMRQFGFSAPKEANFPGSPDGMSPTAALGMQGPVGYGEEGMGGMGFMGSKLRQLLIPLMVKHQLEQPYNEMDRMYKLMQIQNQGKNYESQDAFRKSQDESRRIGHQTALLGMIDNLVKQRQTARLGGDPKDLEMIDNAFGIIKKMTEGMGEPGNISTPQTSNRSLPPGFDNPNRTPSLSELNPPDSGENPWWDRAMPSNAPPFVPNAGRVAEIQRRMQHLQMFAPGDQGAMMALQRELQNELTPPLNLPGGGGATGGPLPKGVTVRKN